MTTEHIWTTFSKRLLHFIRQRVSDPDVANDLLQDVFVRIHLNLATLTDDDKLTSWVYQITRNRLLDHHRATKSAVVRSSPVSLEDEPTDSPGLPDYTATLARCVQPFIDQLDEIYRDAIWSTDIRGISQKAYAQQLGLTYSATKSRIQRARQQLHRLFMNCCRISADRYGTIVDYRCKTSCTC